MIQASGAPLSPNPSCARSMAADAAISERIFRQLRIFSWRATSPRVEAGSRRRGEALRHETKPMTEPGLPASGVRRVAGLHGGLGRGKGDVCVRVRN